MKSIGMSGYALEEDHRSHSQSDQEKSLVDQGFLPQLEEIISQHRERLLACAQRIVPHVTEEDLLQPNDYIELETHPEFRYEEGVLEGLLTARMALLSMQS